MTDYEAGLRRSAAIAFDAGHMTQRQLERKWGLSRRRIQIHLAAHGVSPLPEWNPLRHKRDAGAVGAYHLAGWRPDEIADRLRMDIEDVRLDINTWQKLQARAKDEKRELRRRRTLKANQINGRKRRGKPRKYSDGRTDPSVPNDPPTGG